jgi:Uma2 family endonuclease
VPQRHKNGHWGQWITFDGQPSEGGYPAADVVTSGLSMQPVRPVVIPCTYEDYAAMPADGRRWELIDGEFEVTPAPGTRHQNVSRYLQYELMRQLDEPGIASVFCAPFDVILSPNDVVQPDLMIVRSERKHIVTERGIEGAPDIVVEILSPSSRVLDRRVKLRTYARHAVPEYWIVDGDLGHLEVFRPGTEGYVLDMRFDRASTLVTPSFPELQVALARVFRS